MDTNEIFNRVFRDSYTLNECVAMANELSQVEDNLNAGIGSKNLKISIEIEKYKTGKKFMYFLGSQIILSFALWHRDNLSFFKVFEANEKLNNEVFETDEKLNNVQFVNCENFLKQSINRQPRFFSFKKDGFILCFRGEMEELNSNTYYNDLITIDLKKLDIKAFALNLKEALEKLFLVEPEVKELEPNVYEIRE